MRWSVLFVLLALACKPAVRQEKSDLQAVADDRLTLGVTPVTSSEGGETYRLLVCRKAMSYPQWMLEDQNHCKPALQTEGGDEVVFLPDHLQRDFATRYQGYAKGVVPAIVGIGATAAAILISPRVIDIAKGVKSSDSKPVKVARSIGGGVAKPFKWLGGRGFVKSTGGFFRSAWDKATGGVKWVAGKLSAPFNTQARINRASTAFHHANFMSLDQQLKAMTKNGKTRVSKGMRERVQVYSASEAHLSDKLEIKQLKKFKKNSPEDRVKYIEGLKDENNKLFAKVNEGRSSPYKDIDDLISKSENRGTSIFQGGNTNVDLLRRHISEDRYFRQIKRNKSIIDRSPDLAVSEQTAMINVDRRIADLENGLKAKADAVAQARGNIKHSVFGGVTYKDLAVGAVAVATPYAVMTSLDQSIWGHADRQTNKYWSQIFHEDGSFGNVTSVKDIPGILKSLADAFGFTVNSKALALGN